MLRSPSARRDARKARLLSSRKGVPLNNAAALVKSRRMSRRLSRFDAQVVARNNGPRLVMSTKGKVHRHDCVYAKNCTPLKRDRFYSPIPARDACKVCRPV